MWDLRELYQPKVRRVTLRQALRPAQGRLWAISKALSSLAGGLEPVNYTPGFERIER